MLVSVLINNYNYERFLRRSIDSALNQTYSDVEVIVVDDGSTDESRNIIAGYGSRITPVFKANGGQSSALNAGFAASRGEVICLLDADDEFVAFKVERVVQEFQAYPNSWCFHQMQFVDENSTSISGSPVIDLATGVHDLRSEWSAGHSQFEPPATSGLSFSRRLLCDLLPMPESIRITSDNYLKFSSVTLTPGVFISESLSLQRIHGKNAYTLNYEPVLRANTNYLTGKAIRERHPELGALADRLVANGLGHKYRLNVDRIQATLALREYASRLPLAQRLFLYARFCYQAFLETRRAPVLPKPKRLQKISQNNLNQDLNVVAQ